MSALNNHFYDFGPFRLDPTRRRLLRDGKQVPLSRKAIDVLLVLVANSGQVLERGRLIDAVWKDTAVEDANLSVHISAIRKALGETADAAQYIETEHGAGYRFLADVHETCEAMPSLIIEKRTLSTTTIEEELIPDERPVTLPAHVTSYSDLFKGKRAQLSVAVSLLLLAVVTGGVIYSNRATSSTNAAAAEKIASLRSIAVLPPRSLSPETDQSVLSLGLADALITRLASMNRLSVRPTSAVIRFVDGNPDSVNAGRALGVDAVLEGSWQRDTSGVRVTLRLISVANGSQLWAANFDEKAGNIFNLQDAIAKQVGEALFPHLSDDDRVLLAKSQTPNPEAYANYLKGNYYWNKRGPEVEKSFGYLRKAIEIDPNFAQAYTLLAAAYACSSMPSPEAEVLIEKALRLDHRSASAHATYGLIRMFHHWDWQTAEKELNRALELDPYSATAHHWKGVYLSLQGRLDEAKAEMKRALELDPLSLIVMADLGQLHYFAHEYDQAIAYCQKVLAIDGEFYKAHEYLLDMYWQAGKEREATASWVKISYQLDSNVPPRLKEAIARSDFRELLREINAIDLSRSETEQRLRSMLIARNFLRLGNKQAALHWLEVTFERPCTFWQPYLNVDPLYDGVRSDPRFQALLRKMDL